MTMHDGQPPAHEPPPPASAPAANVAWSLAGELPCIGCRYDLRGLSIRGRCPECGIAIRATILAVVDPRAKEFEPLFRPMLTTAGMLVWAVAAVAAGALTWWMRVNDFIGPTGASTHHDRFIAMLATACLLMSGAASLTFVCPHKRVDRRHVMLGLLGAAAYVPLAMCYWRLHGHFDLIVGPPYFEEAMVRPRRLLLRAGVIASAVVILLGLRPVARSLAARSLIIRTGRVDRQTMLAMVAVLGVAIVGDLLQLSSLSISGELGGVIRQAGIFLVATGSALLTIGMVGVLIDVTRLAPVLVRPPPTLGALLGRQPTSHKP